MNDTPDPYNGVALGVECAWPRTLLITLSAAALTACAAPHAPTEFDFSELDALPPFAAGIVEQVEPAGAATAAQGYAEAIEHAVRPEPEQRVLIRLEGGRTVTVLDRSDRFHAGQRVRLVSGALEPAHE